MKGEHILSGALGALIVILFILAASVFFKPFDYKAVYIANPKKATLVSDSLINKEITCEKINLLKELEDKGLLLTPQEYTSHISNYYSTLVAFLIGLFVLFTIGSIFSIKITSKNEIDDAKKDLDRRQEEIKNNLRTNIQSALSELLQDSISYREMIVSAIYGRVEDELVRQDDLDVMESKIKAINNTMDEKTNKLQKDISSVFEVVDEIISGDATSEAEID